MNDDFLRQLRPRPRAAFVHELKSKLDRLPGTRPLASGPAYLRTLLIALLLGGAAFAFTMLASRQQPLVARVSAPASHASAPAKESVEATSPEAAASPADEVLTPAIPHAIRRESSASAAQAASDAAGPSSSKAGVVNDAPVAAETAVSQVVAGIALAGADVGSVAGAGSEFPAAIFAAWGKEYRRAFGVSVRYDWTGGGGGVRLLQERGTTFAALDVPLEAAELKASGLFQFPMLVGAVVPIVRLPGVKPSQLALDGPTLARIYLGEIAHWNDPPIQKLNPGLALPGTRITLVYRLDTATSTRVLTEYLSRSSPWFQSRYGVTTKIDVSPGAAARGNDGMLDLVERTDGAIGYIDYLYAKQHGVESIRLINREGRIVPATAESLQSAAMHADWLGAPEMAVSLIDVPGEKTWPMSTASFVVMQSRGDRPHTAAAVQFFDWAYRNGSKTATELGYGTIPPPIADRVRASWGATLGKSGLPATSGK